MPSIWSSFKVRPRFLLSAGLGFFAYLLLVPLHIKAIGTKAIIAWDVGALFHAIAIFHMMIRTNHEKITSRAQEQAEGQSFILLFSCLATIISVIAVIIELSAVKSSQNFLGYGHLFLAGGTIFLSWVFIHTIFGLHYAHAYYENICLSKPGGLLFPGKEMPDYFDFLYFSFVIGTSGQTADVSIANRNLRRIGTLHCILAYIFNTTVLALTINMASGLF